METGLQKDTWHNQNTETIQYQFILHNSTFTLSFFNLKTSHFHVL